MKTVKYLLSAVLLITAIWSCTEDEFGSIDFVSTATAPTNVSALFDVTQDNTGTVTITPVGEGAASYDVSFGDGAAADATAKSGESLTHIYPEGSFDVQLTAYGVTGLKTEATVPLVVSFKAPENLVVEISNDEAISKQVNVTATADFAVSFDVFFGETGNDTPVSGNIGSTVSYVYQEAGTYTIRLVAKGAAIATTEHTEEFEVTAIMQPLNSAPTPPGREAADVVSIFGTAYDNVSNANYFPDWGQAGQGSSWAMFDLNSDEMLQYINLSYQGIQFDAVDISNMEYFHMDVWTADLDKIETSLISLTNGEKPVVSDLTADEWTSIDIPVADWTSQGLTVADLFQLKFVGDPWAGGSVFIDNIYFWKTPAAPSELIGTWQLAPQADALGVGPAPGDLSWWSIGDQGLIDRACYVDDNYVFGSDGSFSNVLGADTWIESWQGTEGCGAPVAPHDGTNPATWTSDDTTITISGLGAYLGLPKAHNTGEDGAPVNNTIVYNYTLSNNNDTLDVSIEAGSGVWWNYKFVRN
ncbi:MAG: PKD domain-containing protein [Lutibacter sp.]|nr:PKD domain-containing protein [Lutibacter sp.]